MSYNIFQNHNDRAMVLSHFIKNLVVVVSFSTATFENIHNANPISSIASPK